MNITKFVVLFRRMRWRGARSAAVMAATLAASQTPVLAGPTISGTPEAVTLNVQDSSIGEILAGLGHDFDVHYRSSADLDLNRHLTGTYKGSLRQVVTRILDGYNFIIASSSGGMEVTILGRQNAETAPVSAPVSVGVPWPANFPKR